VTDAYHGLTVVDEYRWLENFDDPATREWNAAQNGRTRAMLDSLPALKPLHARLEALYTSASSDYYGLQYRAGRLLAVKFQPPKEQPFLVSLASADDPASERVIVDPNVIDPTGGTAIDWYAVSLDGMWVGVSLSKGGREEGTVYVYDAATGAALEDVIPRVNYPTAGGSLAWNANGSGFYYTRYPRGAERPPEDLNFYQQVYFHKLGAPTEDDAYVIGREFPRIAEIQLETSADGRYVLAGVANGDGGEYAHYLLDPDGQWTQITQFTDEITRAAFGLDGHLYLLSRKGAPRGRVLRVPLDAPSLANASAVVEESAVSIVGVTPTETRLYVTDVDGGPSQMRVFDLAGQALGNVALSEPVSSVQQVLRLEGDGILFRSASFITPPAWHRHDPASGQTARTALFVTAPADFGDCEVVREFAVSRDGTRVPLNIIRRKGARLDGQNPVLLTGYGGYGASLSPQFAIRRRVWLDAGGVIVIANLRGGGEYGEAWHKAGNLTNKQNVFDDFAACARHLMAANYTQPARLAIEGGSNGGLLMGAALTQHPELFRAVVAHVGLYDMLRVELDPNGAFNVTEFGTVANPQHFEALYDYSPYHHVTDDAAYPAVLLVTGENDGRVNPMHSRKMAARLQAATGSARPILLRTSASSGHGLGTALHERIATDADVFAFLFEQMGIAYS
jgi:prolyl oligopeptidase